MLEEACEESQSPNQQDLQVQSTETWRTKDKSVEKLFGNKEYRYKLRLKQKFPITIYKERNINLAIELIDAKKNISMNGTSLSIKPTSSIWVSPPAKLTDSGCLKLKMGTHSSRERPRPTSITVRPVSPKSTREM